MKWTANNFRLTLRSKWHLEKISEMNTQESAAYGTSRWAITINWCRIICIVSCSKWRHAQGWTNHISFQFPPQSLQNEYFGPLDEEDGLYWWLELYSRTTFCSNEEKAARAEPPHVCYVLRRLTALLFSWTDTESEEKTRKGEAKKISDKFCPIFLLWIRFCIYSSAAYTSILYFPYLILNTYSLSCAQNSVPDRSCNPPHRRVTAESEIQTRRPERTHYGTLVINLCHSCGSQRCKMSVTKNWTSG